MLKQIFGVGVLSLILVGAGCAGGGSDSPFSDATEPFAIISVSGADTQANMEWALEGAAVKTCAKNYVSVYRQIPDPEGKKTYYSNAEGFVADAQATCEFSGAWSCTASLGKDRFQDGETYLLQAHNQDCDSGEAYVSMLETLER